MPRKFDESKRVRTRRNTDFHDKYERITESGCWIWMAGTFASGYGEHRGRGAHRVSYELHNGPIPKSMLVCHRCDIYECVNPAHLYAGTHADNSRDAVLRGQSPRGERNGHAKLTADQVRGIRASSVSGRKLAISLGVSRSLVTAIRRGERWAHQGEAS